jgi:hypothetical protein
VSHWLSRGIRIYEHAPDRRRLGRDNFNFAQGMGEWESLQPDIKTGLVRVLAVGSEGGAMAVHYQWTR